VRLTLPPMHTSTNAPDWKYPSGGAEKFDKLIVARKLNSRIVADQLGTNRVTVHQWRHRQVRPSTEYRLKIAAWSREPRGDGSLGEATILRDDWLLAEEAEIVRELDGATRGAA
jgi:hypothetical protein